MFDKIFRKDAVHPEDGPVIKSFQTKSPNILLSMPELTDGEGETKVAHISAPPHGLYERIVYKLDILIPLVKKEEEIVIPPGSYLQRVLYGKVKKLRVMRDEKHGLPLVLHEPKTEIEFYRVAVDNNDSAVTMIDMGSSYIRKWDNFTLILLVFTASVTPFETAFIEAGTTIDILFLVNRVVDLAFLYDMTIQIRTPFRDATTGVLISDFSSVSKAYLKSWFTIDFISIFPFEFLTWGQETAQTEDTEAGSGNLAILRLLRLARLLKLLRILRASRKLQRFRVNSRIKYSSIQLYTFITAIIFLIHWLACGYKIVSERTSPTDPNRWADMYAIYKNQTVAEVPTIDFYLLALYWSASTITLVGPGFAPVQPVTDAEWGYAVVANIIGYFLVVSILSNLTDLNVWANKDKRNHELKVDKYLDMFANLYINPQIKFKVHEYLNNQFALADQSEYKALIKALPQQWNGIINLEIFLPFINQIPFLEPFIDVEANLMIDICRNIEMLALPPNSFLFQGGLKGIYRLEKGIVAIDGKIYVRFYHFNLIILRGDIIGQTVLRQKGKRVDGRCLTNVEAQFLPKESLEQCLLKHRKLRYYARRWTSWELVRRYIRQYTRLYYLACIRGSLMHPPMYSKRGNMAKDENDDIDYAVMEHIEDYGYY